MKNLTIYVLATLFLFSGSCKEAITKSENEIEDISHIINETTVSRIDSTLKGFVNSGDIAGISALIFEKDKEVYYNAFGYANLETKKPMDRNTIVQIYSMTKPITGTALMTLFEQGAFKLDDPISKYASEFANMKVYAGEDASGKIILEEPKRPISIRDITRHTAGFARNTSAPGIGLLVEKADAMNRKNTLTEMAEKLGKLPLQFHPGEQWEYGPCVDVQAFLVERISGIPYREYVRQHVLDPLGMNETRYFVPENDRDRFSAMYLRSEGQLKQIPDEEAKSDYLQHWPLTRGGSGLTSTLDNYMRFAQMLVNKGTLDEVTILQPKTVKLMATNQLADSIEKRSFLPSKGQVGFGIDFAVRLRPPASEEENYGMVGEFFWDGAASTLFWIDPTNDLTAIMFVQLFPYDQIGLHKGFRDAVYSSFSKNGN